MKKEPDILSFDKWKEQFTDEEIDELVETHEDDLVDTDVECPSCEGNGNIEFEHSFKLLDGTWKHDYYECECEYCNGSGSIDNPSDITLIAMNKLYESRLKDDITKYKQHYDKFGKHEN